MTPLQMGIMLAVYTGSYDSCSRNTTSRNTKVYIEQRNYLIENNLIIEHKGLISGYKITEKGKFWLKYVLTTPFPVPKWEIPNER